jgi:DNA-binding TFAR19-related protein (PDSD5 family)
MSDKELTALREKKLRELQKKFGEKRTQPQQVNKDDVLNKIFKDRAWEVFNAALSQFPDATSKVREVLVKLASSGKLKEVTGEDLFVFLRKLGLDVKLNTKITYASHGQLRSLEEKMKEELQRT